MKPLADTRSAPLTAHRVRWCIDGERGEMETCDVDVAKGEYETRRSWVLGPCVGWVSRSIDGYIVDHAQTAGHVREVE